MCLWFLSFFSMQALDNEIWRIKWDFSFFKRGVSLASRAKEPSCFTTQGKEENPGWSVSTLWFRPALASNLHVTLGKPLWIFSDSASFKWGHWTRWSPRSPPVQMTPCAFIFSCDHGQLSSFCSECTGRSSKPSREGKQSSEKVDESNSCWLQLNGTSQHLGWI